MQVIIVLFLEVAGAFNRAQTLSRTNRVCFSPLLSLEPLFGGHALNWGWGGGSKCHGKSICEIGCGFLFWDAVVIFDHFFLIKKENLSKFQR